MPPFVVYSDLHLHNWPYGSTLVDGYNSRLLQQVDVLRQIGDFCKQTNTQHLIFCGDFFHTHSQIATSVLSKAYEALANLRSGGLTMHFLRGNHDTADRAGAIHSLDFLREFGRVTPLESHQRFSDGTTWNFLGYTEDEEKLYDFLDRVPHGGFVFLHQGVANVPMGSGFVINEILRPDRIPDHIGHIFTGHYHNRRQVGERITIIGSPMQLNWSDVGEERGWLYYDGKQVYGIESKAPQFQTIDFGGCTTVQGASLSTMAFVFGNFLRVRNTGAGVSQESLRQELRTLGALSVEFEGLPGEPKTISEGDEEAEFAVGLPELLERFHRRYNVAPVRRRIGERLREGRYEVPQV